MTIKIHLGVADVPYARAYQSARKRPGPGPTPAQQAARSKITTGDVAEILEARYSIMHHFLDLHHEEIGDALLEALEDKLEQLARGETPESGPLFAPGDLADVEQAFRKMLDERELDGKADGVPTKAALAGVDHRLKHPYARSNPPRSSFIDTGLYQSMMRVWSD